MFLRLMAFVLGGLVLTSSSFGDPIIPATYTASTSIPGAGASQTGSSTQSVVLDTSGLFSPNPFGRSTGAAVAGPNDLGVYGLAAGSADLTNPGGGSAQSIATFSDTLAVSGPSTGFLDVTEDIEGDSIDLNFGSGSSLTETFLRLFANQGNACVNSISNGDSIAGCGILEDGPNNTFLLPYTLASNGTTTFGGEFFTFDNCSAAAASGFNSCFGQASFLDTAQIVSITVEDSNGNLVPGATVTSLSGVDYSLPVQPTATPEPSTLVLLGTGLAGMGSAFLKRRT
jgi:PEP-CTERM motif